MKKETVTLAHIKELAGEFAPLIAQDIAATDHLNSWVDDLVLDFRLDEEEIKEVLDSYNEYLWDDAAIESLKKLCEHYKLIDPEKAEECLQSILACIGELDEE